MFTMTRLFSPSIVCTLRTAIVLINRYYSLRVIIHTHTRTSFTYYFLIQKFQTVHVYDLIEN